MSLPGKLYKYESFNTYSLANLQNNQIFFSKPITFNDPFDCSLGFDVSKLTESEIQTILNENEFDVPKSDELGSEYVESGVRILKQALEGAVKETSQKIRDQALNDSGVSCFSEHNTEILMWSHYTNNHTGFCLEFDTGHEPFSSARKVNYEDEFPTIESAMIINRDISQLWSLLLTKFTNWSYEKEWRIIIPDGGKPVGYETYALTGIYFGCKIDQSHADIIKLVSLAQNPDIKFYKGEMSSANFELHFSEDM